MAIDAVFSRLSIAEIVNRLESAQIAYSRMNSVAEFVNHPQLSARDCWREIGSPAGALRALLPPVRMDGVDPVMGPIPSLGQHTQAILEEIGIERDTIEGVEGGRSRVAVPRVPRVPECRGQVLVAECHNAKVPGTPRPGARAPRRSSTEYAGTPALWHPATLGTLAPWPRHPGTLAPCYF